MTVANQINILDRKIKLNEAQCIPQITWRYEYFTNEYVDLKPSTVEQAKFEYYLWGKTFSKELKEQNKKERLLKRLENIEGKHEEKLKALKNKTENIKEVTDFVKEPLSLGAKGLIEEIKIIQKDIHYRNKNYRW